MNNPVSETNEQQRVIMCDVPEIGKNYNYYHDWKIREIRRNDVKITALLRYKDVPEEIRELFIYDVMNSPHLYASETDFFVSAELDIGDINPEIIYFVRTVCGNWFSLGFWGGVLYT